MSVDDDIAAWVGSIRLSDAAADEVYQRIVASPAPATVDGPGLDPRWWRGFTADFTARMVVSTRPAAWAA